MNLFDIGNVISSAVKEYHDNPWRKLNRQMKWVGLVAFFGTGSYYARDSFFTNHWSIAWCIFNGVTLGLLTSAALMALCWQLSPTTKGLRFPLPKELWVFLQSRKGEDKVLEGDGKKEEPSG